MSEFPRRYLKFFEPQDAKKLSKLFNNMDEKTRAEIERLERDCGGALSFKGEVMTLSVPAECPFNVEDRVVASATALLKLKL